jgi:kanamycin nucleotidyltransferase
VAEAVGRRHGNGLRALALEGSSAKGLAAPRSDLEFCVLLASDRTDRWHTLFVSGMFVGLTYMSPAQALREARSVDYEWPVAGDRFTACRVLYDPDGLYGRLRRAAARAAAHADFAALAREALADMHESVLKVFSVGEDSLALSASAREAAYWAALAVALVNRHRYASVRAMYEESTTLEDLPSGYAGHVGRLLSAGSGADDLRRATGQLWRAMRAWSEARGTVWDDPGLDTL